MPLRYVNAPARPRNDRFCRWAVVRLSDSLIEKGFTCIDIHRSHVRHRRLRGPYGEAILAAYRATSLLYPIEKTRLQNLLRGADADAFVRAAARFALGEGKSALRAMETLLRPHDNAKWTVATYLPFLWRPDRHVFLKPEVTKNFAARVQHPLEHRYDAGLDYGVYESLLDLSASVSTAFADLGPRDMIDIQGVIYVVGDLRDGREYPQP